jgi:hypothetical protein
MLCIATLRAKKQVREVPNAKTGLQIVNVYACLKGTNLALRYHPLIHAIRTLKSPGIESRIRRIEGVEAAQLTLKIVVKAVCSSKREDIT